MYSDVVENGSGVGVTAADAAAPDVVLPENAPEGMTLPDPQPPTKALDLGALQEGFQIVASGAFSFSDDATCGFTGTGDRENAGDPLLGALGDNGGPTPTRLPLTGSPLLDFIPLSACPSDVTTDQRLLARPSGPGCEIGSVEIQLVVPFTG